MFVAANLNWRNVNGLVVATRIFAVVAACNFYHFAAGCLHNVFWFALGHPSWFGAGYWSKMVGRYGARILHFHARNTAADPTLYFVLWPRQRVRRLSGTQAGLVLVHSKRRLLLRHPGLCLE
jgi:hypothetical protein